MKKYLPVLKQCKLFDGIDENQLLDMITCLHGKTNQYSKGSFIFQEGDPIQYVGVVLSGSVQIIQEDISGNRNVMIILQPSQLFAEVFSCAHIFTMPVSVVALSDCEVLLLNCKHIFMDNSCQFHNQLMKNLLQEIAQKNLILNQKIRYMSQKTTQEKLMTYLSDQAKQQGKREFVIPHNRQSLADYLGVDRSAMSYEISKLKKAGKIDTKGSWFIIK